MIPPRMTKNPARPIRHRAGKATVISSDSDSDLDDNQPQQIPKPMPTPAPRPTAGKVLTNIGQFASSNRQKAAELSQSRQRPSAQELKKLAAEQGFITEEENEEDDEDSDEDNSDDGSSNESSSEDDAPRRLMLRPKFIPKAQRQAAAMKNNASEASVAAVKFEEKRLLEEEIRKKAETDRLVEEQIKKDLTARATKKKHWDDNEDEDNIDDTDDIDPEAELATFKLRKLKRYKRDREAMISREKELEEIERRRNLTEEERKKEDDKFLAKQRTEQESKGQMAYMQKYHHKGAFYQEQAEAAGLASRDIMSAKFADEIKDRSVLPEYLQRRDMTKLGRKGATKYKDMKSENSGRWGDVTERRPGEGNRDTNWRQRGAFHGVDDRFKPDDDFRGGKGANSVPLGARSDLQDDRRRDSRSFNRERGDSYKGRDCSGKRERRRSRSYEVDRDRDRRDGYRRSSRDRSMSPRYRWKRSSSRDDHDRSSDKRKRVHL